MLIKLEILKRIIINLYEYYSTRYNKEHGTYEISISLDQFSEDSKILKREYYYYKDKKIKKSKGFLRLELRT